MHPAVRRAGLSQGDEAFADSFLRHARRRGVSEAEALAVIGWYAQWSRQGGRVSAQDAALAFEYEAGQRGWSPAVIEAAAEWHTIVDAAGGDPEAIPAAPDGPRPGDAARLAEIQRILREDPRRYWRDQALQDEFARLLSHHPDVPTPADRPLPAAASRAPTAPPQIDPAELRLLGLTEADLQP